jgi:hypothetical protein
MRHKPHHTLYAKTQKIWIQTTAKQLHILKKREEMAGEVQTKKEREFLFLFLCFFEIGCCEHHQSHAYYAFNVIWRKHLAGSTVVSMASASKIAAKANTINPATRLSIFINSLFCRITL